MEHNFNGKRLHAMGRLVCEPDGSQADLVLPLQPNSLNEEAVIAYLQALHRQVPGLLVLLWDRLAAHRGHKLGAYQTQNPHCLDVEGLPAYAPELNPLEYVWSAAKGKPPAKLAPDRIEKLEQVLKRTPRKMRKRPEDLQQFLIASALYTEEMIVKT